MSRIRSFLFLMSLMLFLYSCKKEEQYNPDQHITYQHWYELKSSSSDTLYSVYVPNAFTPNGDGINDGFLPQGYFKLTRLQIYDAWGTVIFETTNSYKEWNGSSTSSDLEIVKAGSYAYRFTVKDANEVDHEYTGNVMLFE